MNDVAALPGHATRRMLAVLAAFGFGFLGAFSLTLALIPWTGLLTKLDWWEIWDWSLALGSITQVYAPFGLVCIAVSRRIGERVTPGIRSHEVGLAALPLLLLPATFLLAWQPGVPFEAGVDKPDEVVWFGRVVELAVPSALALLGAAYAWVVPRPSIRGLIRMESLAIPVAYALTFPWTKQAHPYRIAGGESVDPLVPLFVACVLMYLLTIPPRDAAREG